MNKATKEGDTNSISLNKKKMEDDSNQLPDDGLYIPINKEKKKFQHVSFYCRTENKDLETCDIKLFNLDIKSSKYNK
jgi:hypothetical protein